MCWRLRGFWRSTVNLIMPAEFPDVTVEHLLVDSAAMHLLQRAARLRCHRDRKTCSAIFSPMRRPCSPDPWACCPSASLSAEARGGVVRTHSWIRARHRRPRHRQSLCRDPERRDAAALRAAPQRKKKRKRWRTQSTGQISSGALTADLAAPGKAITTRAAADAVLAGL